MSQTVFAHLTDIHLPIRKDPPIISVLNKRILGLLSWKTKRRARHREEAADLIAADIHTQTPNAVLVSGDITNIALPTEFRDAKTWLDERFKGLDVIFTPGNHDAYISTSWDETLGLLADRMTGQRQGENTDRPATAPNDFPYTRTQSSGRVAVIAANSAPPTLPGLASGKLGDKQLSKISDTLEETANADQFRLLMLHHPVNDDVVPLRKALDDRSALRDVFLQKGVDLVIHGHTHRTDINEVATPSGPAPVIGAGSASHPHGHGAYCPARYNLIHIEETPSEWKLKIDVRELDPDTGKINTAQTLHYARPRASTG